jgi:hypothetical protein
MNPRKFRSDKLRSRGRTFVRRMTQHDSHDSFYSLLITNREVLLLT